MKFSKTDSGRFRSVIAAVLGDHTATTCYPVYNDKRNANASHRRLKFYDGGYCLRNYAAGKTDQQVVDKLTVEAVKVFGLRFRELKLNKHGEICMLLRSDTTHPQRPVPRTYQRPAYLTANQRTAFWREALGVQQFKYNTFVKLVTNIHVFKKVYTDSTVARQAIANLIIPAGSLVYVTNGKCRADKAIVHSIYSKGGQQQLKVARSGHDLGFLYVPGETVTPSTEKFSVSHESCAPGIHFFIDINNALDW